MSTLPRTTRSAPPAATPVDRAAVDGDAGPAPRFDKWGHYGRGPLALLAGVGFIDAVDRGILPGVLSLAQDDLGFSDTQAGLLGSIFVLMGFLVALPSGYLADRRRRTRVISIVLVSWGVISAANAAVRTYAQFLVVRAALGVGETVNQPAAQSLLADYYPAAVRGRAYAFQRVAPTVGTAFGLGLGGAVGSIFGWRWAFLLVGVPGSLLAVTVWRLPEPRRGESDGIGASASATSGADGDGDGAAGRTAAPPPRPAGVHGLLEDAGQALRVRTLRSLMVSHAVTGGATAGFAFWAATFYERHTSLSAGQAAGFVGALVLVGAVAGTLTGGFLNDRLRGRFPGASMVFAGVSQLVATAIFATTFLAVPLWYRVVGHVVGVLFLVAALPAVTATMAEVVPASIRGISFSFNSFLNGVAAGLSPLMIGLLADQFPFVEGGEVHGNLATAFLLVCPLMALGSVVVLQGRRFVTGDVERAAQGLVGAGV